MGKSERFGLVLSPAEKAMLQRLAQRERIPAAAVVRRLIWREARECSLLPSPDPYAQGASLRQEVAP